MTKSVAIVQSCYIPWKGYFDLIASVDEFILFDDRQFTRIAGMDVSYRALEMAMDRLKLDRMPTVKRERITLLHGSLT